MLESEKELKEVQVEFSLLPKWSSEYCDAVGRFVIACSQWEYVCELLCKDLGLSTGKNFSEKMRDADSIIKRDIHRLKQALQEHNNPECKEIVERIDELEKYKSQRHLLIHGFHHIYEGKERVTYANKYIESIGEVPNTEEIKSVYTHINSLINQINYLRKRVFHVKMRTHRDINIHLDLTFDNNFYSAGTINANIQTQVILYTESTALSQSNDEDR